MTTALILFLGMAAAALRGALCLFFTGHVLTAGKHRGKGMAAAAAGTALLAGLTAAAGLKNFWQLLAETLWIVFCVLRFQHGDGRMGLFSVISFEIGVGLWQFLTAAWLGVAFRTPAFFDAETGKGQIAVWLLYGLMVGAALYLWKHPDRTKPFASVLAVAGFLGAITLSEQKILVIENNTLDMWVCLAAVLMIFLLVFNMRRQYEGERELARLKSQQASLLERDYTALNHAYEENAKLFHDYHNHIGVLRRLLEHKKLGEALEYLDELQAPVKEMTDTVWTGDETADYLINSKGAKARADGIEYQVQIEFPRHTNLKSTDLCAILGNLLDNALEAAEKVGRRNILSLGSPSAGSIRC